MLSVARSFSGVRFFNSDFVGSRTVRIPVPDPDKSLAPLSLARECPSQGRILFVSWRIIPLRSPEVRAFTQSHPFPVCGPQLMGAPREVAFFPCPDISLPLRSPEVSALHSVVFFPCPDGSLPPCG